MSTRTALTSPTWLGWCVTVVMAVVLSGSALLVEDGFGVRLPGAPTAAVATAVGCELMWREGMRLRLLWNEGGLLIVDSHRCTAVRWHQVREIIGEDNQVFFRTDSAAEAGGAPPPRWGMDRLRWPARLSPRYAARRDELVAELGRAWQVGLRDGDAHRPPEFTARRPWALFVPAVVGSAVLSCLV